MVPFFAGWHSSCYSQSDYIFSYFFLGGDIGNINNSVLEIPKCFIGGDVESIALAYQLFTEQWVLI
jgi:hypothetical protein